MGVTRFPNGLTNVKGNKPMANYGFPDPSIWHSCFDDFDWYLASDWAITAIGTGTSALNDTDGGALLITNSALDNEGRQHQKVGESFLLIAGKKAVFKTRLQVSDATQSDLLIGLAVTDTTLLGAVGGDGVTDGIFFYKDDGIATLNISCQKDITTGQLQATSIATLVSGVFMELAWYYDGSSSIEYFVDGVKKGTLDLTSTPTTYLPDTELTVSFALLNGEAVAKTVTIDYILAAIER